MSKLKQMATSMWRSLTNANEEKVNNSQLISKDQLPGSPFHIVGNDEKGYFVCLGQYRLTEPARTKEEAEIVLEIDKWDVISRLIAAYIDFDKKMAVATEQIQ